MWHPSTDGNMPHHATWLQTVTTANDAADTVDTLVDHLGSLDNLVADALADEDPSERRVTAERLRDLAFALEELADAEEAQDSMARGDHLQLPVLGGIPLGAMGDGLFAIGNLTWCFEVVDRRPHFAWKALARFWEWSGRSRRGLAYELAREALLAHPNPRPTPHPVSETGSVGVHHSPSAA